MERGIFAAVVTVSDSRAAAEDISGDTLSQMIEAVGHRVCERIIVTDELLDIRETLFALAGRDDIDIVFTTGGTGFSPRDNTPEATNAVIEREAPGLAEAMRSATARHTPFGMLSRGVCGIHGKVLIINLPGSPKAVAECFEVIAPVLSHAVELIKGR